MNEGLLPIRGVADKLEIPHEYLETIGLYGAKLKLRLLQDPKLPRRGKLILVTGTTPTVSGEGKTVTAIHRMIPHRLVLVTAVKAAGLVGQLLCKSFVSQVLCGESLVSAA